MLRFAGRAAAAQGRTAAIARATSTAAVSDPGLLTDSFGRFHDYLRISLTERCNLRCKYCMPAEGVELQPKDELLTDDEIVRIAGAFASHGVRKIRLTGGEPLIRRGVESLSARLCALPGVEKLSFTTNGMLLARKAPALREAGVTGINVSLDTLEEHKFTLLTRRTGHARVLASLDAALAAGFEEVKVNAVVMRGVNDDELPAFVELTRDRPLHVRFIEYMPFDSNGWAEAGFVPYADMLQRVRATHPTIAKLEDESSATARAWRVPGYEGTVGFIASMSAPFCSGCSRIRLTADGNVKACLFGEDEVSLRDVMREGGSDDELLRVVHGALGRKHATLGGHGDRFGIRDGKNRPMITIGG